MITQKKIAAAGSGKRMAVYQRQAARLNAEDRKLSLYYGGWDAMGTWSKMSPNIAKALGINPAEAPTEEGLARLFEARRVDNGERWTKGKREISAVDLQSAAHKSVTLAVIRAKSPAERASLLQAIWRANDYAIRAFMVRLGVARTGAQGNWRANTRRERLVFVHALSRPPDLCATGWAEPVCANEDETPAPFEFRLGHRRMTSWLCPIQMAQSNWRTLRVV